MKMKRLAPLIAVLLLLPYTVLCACEKQPQKFTAYSFDYFDTVTTIVGYAESQEEFDKISGEIMRELGEYHKLCDIYKRYEDMQNLCTVNELLFDSHKEVKVDPRIIDLLLYAKEMYTLTGGEINIAMGSVLSIWHDYRTEGESDPKKAELPPMESLLQAALHTDIDDIIIDQKNMTVRLADPEMSLDVGAIAKGYAVEKAAELLMAKGIEGYIINVGGNVRTVGSKPDGSAWSAGIENPLKDSSSYISTVSLVNSSLVTSGSYQRYYIVNGEKYHHIIDKDTLMPAKGFVSVSVLCESSGLGDALSTALFCMDIAEGKRLIESLDGIEAIWMTSDGTIYRSSGFSSYE